MKNFIKLTKLLICIWLLTPCLQSCVLYYKTTPEKASKFENRRIRIKTNEDTIYKVKWIELRNDTIHCTTHVERKFLDKSDIDNYMICQPHCFVVNQDTALISKGKILVRTHEFRYRNPLDVNSYNYTFHKIKDAGDYIIGYQWTEEDTVNYIVPVKNVSKIKTADKGASAVVNIFGLLGLTVGIIWFTAMASYGTYW